MMRLVATKFTQLTCKASNIPKRRWRELMYSLDSVRARNYELQFYAMSKFRNVVMEMQHLE